jgi:hypothetical protein
MNKLRDSLEEVVSILSTWTDHLPPVIQEKAQEAIDKAEAALAEPLRNCEVGTAEEQAKRFRSFCGMHKPKVNEFSEHGELLCPSTGCELIACNYGQCALAWVQMPYESEVK